MATTLHRFRAPLTTRLHDFMPGRTCVRMLRALWRRAANARPGLTRGHAYREPRTMFSSGSRQGITLIMLAGLMCPGIASAQTLVVAGTIPKVFVDVKHCEWPSSLCSGSGSVGPAANGNASIVAIYYQGATSGLTLANFSLSSVTNPGGVTPAFISSVSCVACFSEQQPGVYRLAARPAAATNWAGGTYVVLLTVTRPTGGSVTTMIPIDIPF